MDPNAKCLHELFVQQVALTPKNVAVVDGQRTVNYEELDRATDKLALKFRSLGVTTNKCVGIFLPRSLEYVVAYIAALKAGGGYMPLEIAYPEHLLEKICSDATPPVVVTTKELRGKLPEGQTSLCMGAGWMESAEFQVSEAEEAALAPVVNHLDNMAYTVYSSGTTGVPKGIQCPHRGAVFSYGWRHRHIPYDEGKEEREAANVFFVWEMLRPLLQGKALYVIPDDVIYDPPLLGDFLKKNAITRILFTPSLLAALLDCTTLDPKDFMTSLTVVVLCGEVVTVDLRNRLRDAAPNCRIWNLYSISECHDISCGDITDEEFAGRKFCPTGKVMDGVNVIVLDETLSTMLPKAVIGEIAVSGPTLAIGYLNRPELNAKRFISRPPDVPSSFGDRFYIAGDWGQVLSDGTLEITGRCNSMVKVRGYSVELSAIEAALLVMPEVYACVVRAHGDEGSDKHIVAYIVLHKDFGDEENAAKVRIIRVNLKKQLPHYMIPSYFIRLSEIPLTPAGKLDTKALPKPTEDLTPVSEPRNETEAKIAAIFAEVLGRKNVDIFDGFFDLGGHSLLAAKAIQKIREQLDAVVTVADLYASPSVDALAERLLNAGPVQKIDLEAEVAMHNTVVPPLDVQLRAFWRKLQSVRQRDGHVQLNSVFLTGATGYLGAFLLNALLKQTNAHVYCLVRRVAGVEIDERIAQTLRKYNLWSKGLESRITAVDGDVALNQLGLADDYYMYLATEVDVVVHAAAQVNLAYPYYALRTANVIGTANVCSFASALKVKPLHYISTNGVIPPNLKDVEEDVDIKPLWHDLPDGYGQSKWVAERIVMEAKGRGLPVAIYRPGNMSSPVGMEGGAHNTSDFTFLLLTGCLHMQRYPQIEGWKLEMTPVDFAAKMIVHLTQEYSSLGNVYHLVNPVWVPSNKAFHTFTRMGYSGFEGSDFEQWRTELLQHDSRKLDALKAIFESITTPEMLTTATTFSASNVLAVAKEIDEEYPPVSSDLIRSYAIQYVKSSFIPPIPIRMSKRPLEGKTALVTGASGGIGKAIARALAHAGANVSIGARRKERLQAICDEIKDVYQVDVHHAIVDVTKRDTVKAFVASTTEALGPPDILVNNAGTMHYTAMKNLHEDEWEQEIDVNCKGLVNGIGAVLPGMLERQTGHIVNISSDAGRKVFPGLAVYSGTKFFVEAVSQGLRLETAGKGLKVTTIQPGDCKSELSKQTTDEESRELYAQPSQDRNCWLDPEDVANAVIYAVTQPPHVAVNEIMVEPKDVPS